MAVIVGLVAVFTPRIGRQVVSPGLAAFDVAPPPPPPPPPPARTRMAAETAGEAAPRAEARPVAAPVPRIAIAPVDMPVVAGTGATTASGAANTGLGTGAGGSGNGMGGGGGQKLAQIAGAINSAKDYPRETRDRRIGTSVVIVFTVGVDGRVHDCRVRDPSGDPRSDAITCQLAEQRFRFRPATDSAGNPVPAPYGWKQSWFY